MGDDWYSLEDGDPGLVVLGGLYPSVRAVMETAHDLQARINAYEGRLQQWEEMDALIKRSSLGTLEAEAVAAQTPPSVAMAIALGVQYLGRAEEAEAEVARLRDIVAKVTGGEHE